ncbi:MAG: hypothetical protein HY913_14605 [Desulfomonile tiedjei]|nr:hypothetical protein [Desulfomonile tiedjei]
MKNFLAKLLVAGFLLAVTVTAYEAAFHGWFLPSQLDKPVSLRDGSTRAQTRGYGVYFLGGRSHYGGGYRGGK